MPAIVTNPTAGDVHVSQPLTNFSQSWLQRQSNFVSLTAMPNSPVTKQADLYYEFSRADFNRIQAQQRADATESAGGSFKLSTSPYFALVYAIHKDVSDRQRANQDIPVRLDNSATAFVMQQLMLLREVLYAQTFMGTSIWATDLTGVDTGPTGSQFLQWDQAASDPVVDIRDAKQVVQLATGFRPNQMCMGRTVWDALMDNDAVLSRIEGGATTDRPAIVMRRLLAALFEVDAIHVMDAIKNDGGETADSDINDNESNSFIGGDDCLLYYAPMDGLSLDQPTAGAQFSWNGWMGATDNGQRIKRFRMDQLESDRVEGQMAFDYKVTSPELGFYFSDCTAK